MTRQNHPSTSNVFAMSDTSTRLVMFWSGGSCLHQVHKPTIVKACVCVFVSLSVKAVHLELVSDLTTGAFIAMLRRFIAHHGKPSSISSDDGTNFVGTSREPKNSVNL